MKHFEIKKSDQDLLFKKTEPAKCVQDKELFVWDHAKALVHRAQESVGVCLSELSEIITPFHREQR
jgi:hypothetical protein